MIVLRLCGQPSIDPSEVIDQSKSRIKFDRSPPEAVLEGQEGVVVCSVTVLRDGTIASVTLKTGSEFVLLDQEALRAISSITRFPALPDETSPEKASVTSDIPVNFSLPESR